MAVIINCRKIIERKYRNSEEIRQNVIHVYIKSKWNYGTIKSVSKCRCSGQLSIERHSAYLTCCIHIHTTVVNFRHRWSLHPFQLEVGQLWCKFRCDETACGVRIWRGFMGEERGKQSLKLALQVSTIRKWTFIKTSKFWHS